MNFVMLPGRKQNIMFEVYIATLGYFQILEISIQIFDETSMKSFN